MLIKEATSNETSSILSTFFSYLDQKGFNYCVVGPTNELPNKITSDIDIVVDSDPIKVIHFLIKDFSFINKIRVAQIIQHEQSAYYLALSWNGNDGKLKFLHPDICNDYFRNGRKYLTADEILLTRKPAIDEMGKEKGFFVAGSAKEFIYYLLKKIEKQILNKDHGTYLSSIWATAKDECNKEIDRFWLNDDAKLIRKAAQEGNWKKVKEKLPELKKSLQSKLPPRKFMSRGREIARLIKRLRFPTGLHIAFLGPDGSGKSSVIHKIILDLAPVFRNTASSHFRPGLGIKSSNRKPVVSPHSHQVRNKVESLAKVIYFWFDYFIGWWLTIWIKTIRSTLVINDRYFHDILVDPRRYRYGGPLWFAKCIGKMIPKPNLWILLDAPPEVLQDRKQEVPFEETARQRNEYLKLFKVMENCIVIDASQTLDDVVADVNCSILNYMAERIEKRGL